jgi:hypothetical protein
MMRKGIEHPMSAPITALEKLTELEREVAVRRKVYDRFIKEGKMTVPEAARRIGIMQAIAEDYRGMLGAKRRRSEELDLDDNPAA